MPSEQAFHCILSTGLVSCWIGTDKDGHLLFFPVAMNQASYQLHAGPRKWMNIISPSGVLAFASLGKSRCQKNLPLREKKHWNIKCTEHKNMLKTEFYMCCSILYLAEQFLFLDINHLLIFFFLKMPLYLFSLWLFWITSIPVRF
jgi:hypothetical protein